MRNGFRRKARCGFTLLEAIIAMVLVGLVLVAAFHVLGGTTQSTYLSAQSSTGLLLAEGLMAEILPRAYAEPEVENPSIGPESGESSDRTAFDDVDDYDGWTATPPEAADGSPLAGYDAWTRSVTVEYAPLTNPLGTVGSDEGIKRITVTASHGGKTVAELVGYRTDCEVDEE